MIAAAQSAVYGTTPRHLVARAWRRVPDLQQPEESRGRTLTANEGQHELCLTAGPQSSILFGSSLGWNWPNDGPPEGGPHDDVTSGC